MSEPDTHSITAKIRDSQRELDDLLVQQSTLEQEQSREMAKIWRLINTQRSKVSALISMLP